MGQLIVTVLFAAWFGRAAHHAGKDVVPWAAGGAALFLVLNVALLEVAFEIGTANGIRGTGGLLLFLSAWLVSVVAAIAVGVRVLPEGSRDRLAFEVAAQEARAAARGDEAPADTLACQRCGRSLTKRDALVLGAIRIDDATCICPGCKDKPSTPGGGQSDQ
jgi:hypothetical protein